MSEQYPVTIEVRRLDGSVEQVRVGTATRMNEGFSLSLGELTISRQAVTSAPRSSGSAYGGAGSPSLSAGCAVFPNYGRSKGAPVSGASMDDLQFYANGSRRSLSDPSKARFHDKERALLAAIEAEMAKQSGQGSENESAGGWGDQEEIPPPSDEDAPF